jgi:hypothetical protein
LAEDPLLTDPEGMLKLVERSKKDQHEAKEEEEIRTEWYQVTEEPPEEAEL